MVRLARPRRCARRDERGSIAMALVVLMAGFAMMIGLVVDGGGRLQAQERLDAFAQEAARAAGQAINLGAAVSGQRIYVDQGAARQAANTYLATVGLVGQVIVSPDGQTITVTITEAYEPTFLGAFGVGPWQLHGTGSATLVAGVVAP